MVNHADFLISTDDGNHTSVCLRENDPVSDDAPITWSVETRMNSHLMNLATFEGASAAENARTFFMRSFDRAIARDAETKRV